MIYPNIEEIMDIIIEEKVPIVFTSAGNPKVWTDRLKENHIKVAHVIAHSKFIAKCDEAGVDAIVVEGFEAGGHNGREETTTLSLLQTVYKKTSTPIIAAGGIGSGMAMLAAFTLGAKGVQIGSLFAASEESSAHLDFKKQIVAAGEGSTKLTLKQLTPVRLIRNSFFNEVEQLEQQGATKEELNNLLGKGRAKLGMFEGDIHQGELEIGQVSALINEIKPVETIIQNLISQYNQALTDLKKLNSF
jgi:enoyl-[acyl-carrier protein] reductase II